MTYLVFRRLSYAFNLIAARNRVASGDYSHALKAVLSVLRSYSCETPSTKAPHLVNIMYALVAWNLRDAPTTFIALATSYDQLSSYTPKSLRKLRNNKYLIYYCKYLLQFAEYDFDWPIDHDLSELRNYKGGHIEITKIDRFFRESFPVDQEWLESEWGMGSSS